MKNPIRVIVIEDESNLLACLKMELGRSHGISCVGAFNNFESAERAFKSAQPDVLLLDLGLPDIDGIDACRLIKREWPRLRVVVFTVCGDREKVIEALACKADGYLLKETSRQDLSDAIATVHAGEPVFSPTILREIVGFLQTRRDHRGTLSPTEKLVIEAFDRGLQNKQIADQLGISVHTVKDHLQSLRRKLGADSSAQANFIRRLGAR